MKYRFLNNVTGWLTFVAAMIVYTLTVERSVSLWDCGEFLSALYKLQVVHPPGAPFFLMVGRVFSLLAFGDTEMVGFWGNMLSVTSSALTVLFTFWCTTLLAKRILTGSFNGELNAAQTIKTMGSGIVAALALTFMDTFWFSAVEAEVYALSSLLTAMSFWAILKWGSVHDRPGADRWLLFIALIIGLSIGTHLLNLLVIPAIVYFYYLTKYTPTRKGIIYASIIGVAILGFVQKGIIPGIPTIGAKFDLFFVNSLGLPFYSGMFFFLLLIIGGMVYGLMWTTKNKKYLLNKIILGVSFIVIGYSSYSMVVIRALADPPINMNDPDDLYNLVGYINREQYGDRPLLYGPYFTAKNYRTERDSDGPMQYRMDREEGKYVEIGNKVSMVYDDSQKTLFPRMGDMQKGSSPAGYKEWAGAVGGKTKPTMGQNLKYFFRYQLGHMYWRYFMWNFAGRQDDIQGHGGADHGNWITGIGFIDRIFVGPQSNIPDDIKVNNGRNKYYLLPLIIGVLGMFYHYKKHKNDFWVVMALFIFTGVLIVVYLNQPPYEPRERDYTNVGSYQTFCIWIGLGVLFLADALSKYLDKKNAAIGATVICILGAPVLMGAQNWDDHNRGNRSLAIDYAYDYLEPLDDNAILFTNGDNDTYPLWFARNVVGLKEDARIINFALLSSDWYAQPWKDTVYTSAPLPVSFTKQQVADGVRDFLFVSERYNEALYKEFGINHPSQPTDLKNIMKFIYSDDKRTKIQASDGSLIDYVPTKKFYVNVNKENAIKYGAVSQADAPYMVDRIEITLPGEFILKGDMVFMDLLAHNDWVRPIYFSQLSGISFVDQLKKYFLNEGLVHRLTPIDNTRRPEGDINVDKLYKNITETYKYGGLDQGKDIFVDDKASLVPNQLRVFGFQLGNVLVSKANNLRAQANQMKDAGAPEEAYQNLITQADSSEKMAVNVLDKLMTEIPETALPMRPDLKYYYVVFYSKAGAKDKAAKYLTELVDRCEQNLKYYNQFKNGKFWGGASKSFGDYMKILAQLPNVAKELGDTELETRINSILKQY